MVARNDWLEGEDLAEKLAIFVSIKLFGRAFYLYFYLLSFGWLGDDHTSQVSI